MGTIYGKTPLTIHATAEACTLKGWGSHAPVGQKSNWTPDLISLGKTSQGTRGPYAVTPSSPGQRLIAPKASTLWVQMPYSVVLHSQGVFF